MSEDTPDTPPPGDRIAKVLSRAGIASRREAERMIADGRVRVNGKPIDSPALNIGPADRISVDGVAVGQPEPPRLWLYNKPPGLVTTERDEKDRPTVFASLPDDMPRVMSVGRLDLNSEGLLLLTNDGEIKRRLELPATGWLRRYRVRINGAVSEARLDELRAGITVEDITYLPMTVTFDRQQGANAWLTISIREGKNREIRRAMDAIGVAVNRLIRISYGPFQLGNLKSGEVEEIKGRVLRDQLGLEGRPEPQRGGTAKARPKPAFKGRKGAGPRSDDGAENPQKDGKRNVRRDAQRATASLSGPGGAAGSGLSRKDPAPKGAGGSAKGASRGKGPARGGNRSR